MPRTGKETELLYDRSYASIDPDRDLTNILVLSLKHSPKTKMWSVWVASYNYPHEGGGVISVHQSKEGAISAVRDRAEDTSGADFYVTQEILRD